MPKQKDIRPLLLKQIEQLQKDLNQSRASLIYYQDLVAEQEGRLHKLENAKASLDGTLPQIKQYTDFAGTSALSELPARVFAAPETFIPQTVKIGEEDVILEQGFHVEKNSFGEDCIVPDGVKYVPAAEPAATPDTSALFKGVEADVPLPATTSGDVFDSPEDLF